MILRSQLYKTLYDFQVLRKYGLQVKLHNKELNNLYFSSSMIRMIKSRKMKWAGHVAQIGEKRNAYRISVGKPEGKRPLGRPRRRWVDNIKMNPREIGWDGMDWIDLAQDRDHSEHSNEPPGSIKCWEFLEWLQKLAASRRAQLHE
jgi:hypothetical protein